MEGGRHRQQQSRASRPRLRELHRPLDRGLRPGDHHLAAAVVVRGLRRSRRSDRGRSQPGSQCASPRRNRGRGSPPSRPRQRNRLLHRLAAQAQQTRGVLEASARPLRIAPNIRRASGRRRRPPRARHRIRPRFRAREARPCSTAISAGCALAVSVSSDSGPSNISCESFCDSAASTRSKTSRAAGNASASALPMPTLCDP